MGNGLIATLAVIALIGLWTRQRRYRYPAQETEILRYARALAEGFEAASADEKDERTRDQVRRIMIEQFATAAETNRSFNTRSQRYRAQALRILSIGLLFTVAAAIIILIHGAIKDTNDVRRSWQRPAEAGADTGWPTVAPPRAPADADLQQGRMGGVGSQEPDARRSPALVGTEEMTP